MEMTLEQAWDNIVKLARVPELNADNHDIRVASLELVQARLFPPPEPTA